MLAKGGVLMIGANLKYLRLKNGFSQEYVANYLGKKSFTTVQKWESDVSDPPLAIVGKLAELYKVSIDDLFYQDLANSEIVHQNLNLSDKEETMIKKYRSLLPAGKAAVDAVLDSQYEFTKPKVEKVTEIS